MSGDAASPSGPVPQSENTSGSATIGDPHFYHYWKGFFIISAPRTIAVGDGSENAPAAAIKRPTSAPTTSGTTHQPLLTTKLTPKNG
jgi:hypothetical protein